MSLTILYVCLYGAVVPTFNYKRDGYGLDHHSGERNIIYKYFHFFVLISCQNAALNFATQDVMSQNFGGECETECLNT